MFNDSTHHRGHNPLGWWSIIVMLLALLVQAWTRFFANDDSTTKGPLFDGISKSTSDWLTRIHKLNQELIIALVIILVLAVLFYFFFKRENLVKPMITAVKKCNGAEPDPATDRTWVVILVAGLAALAVFLLVRQR